MATLAERLCALFALVLGHFWLARHYSAPRCLAADAPELGGNYLQWLFDVHWAVWLLLFARAVLGRLVTEGLLGVVVPRIGRTLFIRRLGPWPLLPDALWWIVVAATLLVNHACSGYLEAAGLSTSPLEWTSLLAVSAGVLSVPVTEALRRQAHRDLALLGNRGHMDKRLKAAAVVAIPLVFLPLALPLMSGTISTVGSVACFRDHLQDVPFKEREAKELDCEVARNRVGPEHRMDPTYTWKGVDTTEVDIANVQSEAWARVLETLVTGDWPHWWAYDTVYALHGRQGSHEPPTAGECLPGLKEDIRSGKHETYHPRAASFRGPSTISWRNRSAGKKKDEDLIERYDLENHRARLEWIGFLATHDKFAKILRRASEERLALQRPRGGKDDPAVAEWNEHRTAKRCPPPLVLRPPRPDALIEHAIACSALQLTPEHPDWAQLTLDQLPFRTRERQATKAGADPKRPQPVTDWARTPGSLGESPSATIPASPPLEADGALSTALPAPQGVLPLVALTKEMETQGVLLERDSLSESAAAAFAEIAFMNLTRIRRMDLRGKDGPTVDIEVFFRARPGWVGLSPDERAAPGAKTWEALAPEHKKSAGCSSLIVVEPSGSESGAVCDRCGSLPKLPADFRLRTVSLLGNDRRPAVMTLRAQLEPDPVGLGPERRIWLNFQNENWREHCSADDARLLRFDLGAARFDVRAGEAETLVSIRPGTGAGDIDADEIIQMCAASGARKTDPAQEGVMNGWQTLAALGCQVGSLGQHEAVAPWRAQLQAAVIVVDLGEPGEQAAGDQECRSVAAALGLPGAEYAKITSDPAWLLTPGPAPAGCRGYHWVLGRSPSADLPPPQGAAMIP